jgi:hypothetical protein
MGDLADWKKTNWSDLSGRVKVRREYQMLDISYREPRI